MLEQYELDFEALKYWVILFGAISIVSGLYFFISSNPQTSTDNSPLSLYLEDESISAGEVTTLFVEYENETIQGAEIEMEYPGDYVFIGETNSQGALSFETREEDFYINTSYNGHNQSILVEVESMDRGENADTDSGGDSPEQELGENKSDGQDESGMGDDGEGSSGDGSEEASEESDRPRKGTTGFQLESDPVAEEINQLTLLKNGDPLQKTVDMNGEELGETTSAGTLTFKVPNTREITLQASGIEKTFPVSGYEEDAPDTGYVQASMTRSGMAYVGEVMTLNASGTVSDNPLRYYNWTLNHENFNDTLQGEVVEYSIPEEGAYDITLQVEDTGGFTDADTGYMKADPEYARPEIILTNPSEGDTVTAEEEFEFQVDNARTGQNAYVVINGDREASIPLEPGLNIREDPGVTAPISQVGTQNYWIEIEDTSNTWESSKREIENTRAYGDFGTFSIENPSENAEASSPVTFDFSLDLKDSVRLNVRGNAETEDFDFSRTVEESRTSYSFSEEINSSNYNWTASISVPSTSESKSSDPRQIEVN